MASRTAALLLISSLVAGCADKHEEIVSYRVPEPAAISLKDPTQIVEERRKRVRAQIEVAAKAAMEEKKGTPGRMLGTIIPGQPRAWFFKLSGPIEQVSHNADTVRKFLSAVTFEDNTPQWKVPEGWSQRAGDQNRFATLLIPNHGEKPLELTVTALSMGGGTGLNGYLLANLNRWREQMTLPPTEEEDVAKSLENFTLGGKDRAIAYFVDLEGTLKSGGMRPPFAGGFMGGGGDSAPRAIGERKRTAMPADHPPIDGSQSKQRLPFTFTAPENWKPGKLNPLRRAAFEVVVSEKKRIDVTVSTAGGGRLANVNIWRDQVGLPAVSEGELKEILQPIVLDGSIGYTARLVGPAEVGKTILLSAVERQGQTWFFKLIGDSGLAEQERQHFDAFVKSVKFSSAEGN